MTHVICTLALGVTMNAYAVEPTPQPSPNDFSIGVQDGLKAGIRNDWGCMIGSLIMPPLGVPAAYIFTPDGAPVESLASLSSTHTPNYVSGYSQGFSESRQKCRRRDAWNITIAVSIVALLALVHR